MGEFMAEVAVKLICTDGQSSKGQCVFIQHQMVVYMV